ncbi:MAG: hypothetical protein ACYSR1_02080 [Planctomycetota bacterium]|jgi:hypothetical protein
MRIVLAAISLFLLLITTTAGCYTTYNSVTAMSDWELQSEYDNLQAEQKRLERVLAYGGTSYTVTRYSGTILTNQAA